MRRHGQTETMSTNTEDPRNTVKFHFERISIPCTRDVIVFYTEAPSNHVRTSVVRCEIGMKQVGASKVFAPYCTCHHCVIITLTTTPTTKTTSSFNGNGSRTAYSPKPDGRLRRCQWVSECPMSRQIDRTTSRRVLHTPILCWMYAMSGF